MSCAPSVIAACSSRAVLTTVMSAASCADAVTSAVSSMRRSMAAAGTVELTPEGGLTCTKHAYILIAANVNVNVNLSR